MTQTPSRPPEPTFRRGLFEGTAADYDRYRLPYAPALLERVAQELALDGTGRLVDLGAGTGHVARGLRPYFAVVIAVEPEQEMVDFGRTRGQRDGDGIEWLLGRAEDIDFASDSVDVVASGNAFHRFDRPLVAKKAAAWLTLSGSIVLLGSDGPWTGDQPWQRELSRIIDKWQQRSGADARIPTGWERKEFPDAVVLREAGFERLVEHTVIARQTWNLDAIVGFLRATSASSRAALGQHFDAFEADVRKTLLGIDRGGLYEQDLSFGALIARRRLDS